MAYDPFFTQFVKLLCHFDGADAATTTTDSSKSAHTLTANGNVQLDDAQSVFGGTSSFFDGAGDYWNIADHADFEPGAGEFDFRARFRLASSVDATIISKDTGSDPNREWQWIYNKTESPGNNLEFNFWDSGGTQRRLRVSWTPSVDTWYGLRVARIGNTLFMWIDGTVQATTFNMTGMTIRSGTAPVRIGVHAGTAYPMHGWIEELRYTKGIGRDSGSYTLEAEAFPERDVEGSGDLEAQAATVDGLGWGPMYGTGVLAAQAATVDGAGFSGSVGAGVLAAQAADVTGAGKVADVLGHVNGGFLLPGAATVDGAGYVLTHYNIEQEFDIVYRIHGTAVEDDLSVVYQDAISAAMVMEYALGTLSAEAGLDVVYNITTDAEQDLVIDAAFTVEAGLTLSYNLVAIAEAALDLVYGLTIEVEQDLVIVSMAGVEAALEVVYHLTAPAEAALDIIYGIQTIIENDAVLTSDILDFITIEAEIDLRYPIIGTTAIHVNMATTVTVAGQTFPVNDADISQDEGEFAWVCQMTLPNPAQHSLFERDTPFTVNLQGEVYAFITDSKKFSRQPDGNGAVVSVCTIAGISPSAIYADPRCTKITQTWDTAVLARAAVEEVLAGASIDWRILNWSIPAFRLGAQDEAPIDIARRIAAAAGAVIESEPDGSLVVRYAYPVSVPQWGGATPDQIYTDQQHRFNAEEQFATVKTANKLRLLDVVPGGFSDSVEFEASEDDLIRGTLKVYPSPWRDTITVEHTSRADVSATIRGVETEELTETVEIVDGAGSVSHPIYQVVSLDWLYADLTGIAFEVDSRQFTTTHATDKYSLLTITYRTRFIAFDAVGFSGGTVQYLVKDTADG